jgi:hypothetical protein
MYRRDLNCAGCAGFVTGEFEHATTSIPGTGMSCSLDGRGLFDAGGTTSSFAFIAFVLFLFPFTIVNVDVVSSLFFSQAPNFQVMVLV